MDFFSKSRKNVLIMKMQNSLTIIVSEFSISRQFLAILIIYLKFNSLSQKKNLFLAVYLLRSLQPAVTWQYHPSLYRTITMIGNPKKCPGPYPASWTKTNMCLYYFFNMVCLCETITILSVEIQVKCYEMLTATWEKLLENT